jgi:hypothetical protein
MKVMRRNGFTLVVLAIIAVSLALPPHVWAEGETPGSNTLCEISHPTGTAVQSTLDVIVDFGTSTASGTLTLAFRGVIFNYNFPAVVVNPTSGIAVACGILASLESTIVSNLGFPTGTTIHVTEKSVSGLPCPTNPNVLTPECTTPEPNTIQQTFPLGITVIKHFTGTALTSADAIGPITLYFQRKN